MSPDAPHESLSGREADRESIPVLRPLLPCAERILPYLRRIDATRIYANWGPLTRELERRLAAQFKIDDGCVVSASSGTAALIGAILATAGRATNERPLAMVPAFTFVATAIAVERCGYRPYLVDVAPDSWLLETGTLQKHPMLDRTGLIVPVAAFGRSVEVEKWVTFQRRTAIPVVIDGAASFEAIGREPRRLLSELPVALSFHGTKAFSTGEGGCVITTDARLAASVTRSLNFGFYEDRESRSASTNGKMSEYHAAVGLAELDAWPAKHHAFLRVADTYKPLMHNVGLADRLVAAPEVASCYVLYRSADAREATCTREALISNKVEFRSWYGDGVHGQPYFHNVSRDALDVTDRIAPMLIGLPVAPDLLAGDVARVVSALELGASRSR